MHTHVHGWIYPSTLLHHTRCFIAAAAAGSAACFMYICIWCNVCMRGVTLKWLVCASVCVFFFIFSCSVSSTFSSMCLSRALSFEREKWMRVRFSASCVNVFYFLFIILLSHFRLRISFRLSKENFLFSFLAEKF